MKKEKIGKVVGIILFALIVVGVSYVTTYYVDKLRKGDGKAVINVLFDDNEYYEIPNSEILEKDDALLEWPYIFNIENSGDKAGVYQLIIMDKEESDIGRENLSYVILLDDKEIKSGKLDSINNNVLYENKISSNQKQKYKLYIYKDSENSGTVYKYALKINAIEDGGPGF